MSLRKAINDKCRECCYDSKSGLGTWRQQVEGCPCTLCPLFSVRPQTLPKRPLSRVLEAKPDSLFEVGLLNG